jgi:hypothetical protein
MACLRIAAPAAASLLLLTSIAEAQDPPAPPAAPVYYGAQPVMAPPPPPPPDDDHAPKYSLWVGARLSFVAFGFGFYENEHGESETTGNYLKNGLAPQVDLGARISYRYMPYFFYERGFMGQGHRFEGTNTHTQTEYYGLGFQYAQGDVDSVAFLTDISIGKRVIRISNGTQEYDMSGIEFFRLGLGAEIRVKTLFTLSPLASVSTGEVTDSDGNIDFGCKQLNVTCKDGLNQPTYANGKSIDSSRPYVVISLGMGVHFDIFGK